MTVSKYVDAINRLLHFDPDKTTYQMNDMSRLCTYRYESSDKYNKYVKQMPYMYISRVIGEDKLSTAHCVSRRGFKPETLRLQSEFELSTTVYGHIGPKL